MSREEAIAFFKDMNECTYGNLEEVEMAIEALEQEPCEDCVSRRAVQAELKNCEVVNVHDENDNFIGYYNADTVDSIVRNLPPITPQPKMGHWEWNQYDANPKIGNFHCSLCHSIGRTYFDYCPYCGAKMSEIPTGSEGSEE